MAVRKKAAKKPAHGSEDKDHGHEVLTITIGPLMRVRKGSKAKKATRTPKEVKAFLKWALKNA